MNTPAGNKDHLIHRKRLFEHEGITAAIVYHNTGGFKANALLMGLPSPRRALSGREGLKTIEFAFNCHLPSAVLQAMGNRQSAWRNYFNEVVTACAGKEVRLRQRTVLATGVDIDNIGWSCESFEEQWVIAVATAGVKTNALRIGYDHAAAIERGGRFEPAGTINIIIITSARLTSAALAASLVTATEAKVMVLQELDIRSVYSPDVRASGTGTDQVLVISGEGPACTSVGGYTMLGELMGRAVTAAVTASLEKTRTL